MTRSDLASLLSRRFPQLSTPDVDLAVRVILDGISSALATGNRIEIRGFGSFSLNYRPPRTGRNPKTGVKVEVPAKYAPHFKAGKQLREQVDRQARRKPKYTAAELMAECNLQAPMPHDMEEWDRMPDVGREVWP